MVASMILVIMVYAFIRRSKRFSKNLIWVNFFLWGKGNFVCVYLCLSFCVCFKVGVFL